MNQTPIVIFSDHPACSSGLGRITRDLATILYALPEFKVATLGYGHTGSATIPWPQYQWNQNAWFIPNELPFIWNEFCQGEPGILMLIGDVQRWLQVADPNFAVDKGFGQWMRQMRESGKLKLWGYFPIDAHGKDGKLTPQLGHTLSHFDRRLVPSQWGADIVRKTNPYFDVDVIPHGIDTETFSPQPKEDARKQFLQLEGSNVRWPQSRIRVPKDDALWIGIVATNQPRKDWGLGVEVVAELKKTRPVLLWTHIDHLKQDNGWGLMELLSDYGLLQSTVITSGLFSDQSMATWYSAMDLTLGIGRGEGFGYPIFESISCGTPCFAYHYGAHAEYMSAEHICPGALMRIEGPLNLLRPVAKASHWTLNINSGLSTPPGDISQLGWPSVAPQFVDWFRKGIDHVSQEAAVHGVQPQVGNQDESHSGDENAVPSPL